MMWLRIGVVGAFVVGVGCTKKPSYLESKKSAVNMSGSVQDVALPSKLWEELEGVYKPLILDSSTKTEDNSKARLEIPTEFFGFHVYLIEKTKGVLKKGNVDLLFGKGGGMLDLEQFVTEKKGSFYFAVEPMIELGKEDKLKFFYLSNTRHLDIGGEIHGNGCDKYMDVSDYFNQVMKTDGILVNTTQQRHAALLIGSYFMAVSVKGKLSLSQLTIRDSRYKHLACQWK